MYHDEQLPADELTSYHDMYRRLAQAVRNGLGMVRSLLVATEDAANQMEGDHHTTPVLLVYDFMDAIDGVCLLAERGAARNCDLLLRNAYELKAAFIYVTDPAAETRRLRCLAYEYFHILGHLKMVQRADRTSDIGRPLHAELAGDPHARVLDLRGRPGIDLDKEIESWRSKLASHRYEEVRQEVDRMKAARQRVDNWFALWSGPTNLRQLAKATTGLTIYESLYRSWSGVAHGERAVRRVNGKDRQGRPLLTPLRSPEGLPNRCLLALNLCNYVSLHLIQVYVPQLRDAMKEHFINHIRPARQFIQRVKIGD